MLGEINSQLDQKPCSIFNFEVLLKNCIITIKNKLNVLIIAIIKFIKTYAIYFGLLRKIQRSAQGESTME